MIKIPISNKECVKILAYYPYYSESSSSYKYHVTDVKVFWTPTKIICKITTHLPGYLIGKAGKQISEIKEIMQEKYKKPLEIDIEECKLFDIC